MSVIFYYYFLFIYFVVVVPVGVPRHWWLFFLWFVLSEAGLLTSFELIYWSIVVKSLISLHGARSLLSVVSVSVGFTFFYIVFRWWWRCQLTSVLWRQRNKSYELRWVCRKDLYTCVDTHHRLLHLVSLFKCLLKQTSNLAFTCHGGKFIYPSLDSRFEASYVSPKKKTSSSPKKQNAKEETMS